MEYAVFASGGKQYKVSVGDVVELEKLEGNDGDSIIFDQVLLHVVDDSIVVGQPVVTGATVVAKILGQIKGEKIRVAKFKAKARYRKVYGHRQHLTRVQVEKISVKGKEIKAKPVEEKSKKA